MGAPHHLKIKSHPAVFGDASTAGVTIISNNRHIYFSNFMWEELKTMIMQFEAANRQTIQNYVDAPGRPSAQDFLKSTTTTSKKATLDDLI